MPTTPKSFPFLFLSLFLLMSACQGVGDSKSSASPSNPQGNGNFNSPDSNGNSGHTGSNSDPNLTFQSHMDPSSTENREENFFLRDWSGSLSFEIRNAFLQEAVVHRVGVPVRAYIWKGQLVRSAMALKKVSEGKGMACRWLRKTGDGTRFAETQIWTLASPFQESFLSDKKTRRIYAQFASSGETITLECLKRQKISLTDLRETFGDSVSVTVNATQNPQ